MASAVSAWGAGATRLLDLGDGYRFELLGAGETEARTAHPKSLYVNVSLADAKTFGDKGRLIEGADRMFETVLLNGAEKGYYARALVNVRKPGSAQFESFEYVRGKNEVWLREAGVEPWKTAQDAKWNAPAAEKIDIKGIGTLWVEQAVDLPPPEGFKRAIEVDLVTKTTIVNIQQKFREIKALWARMDRNKLRAEGYDLVLIGNFSTRQLGRFHARKGFFVRIPRGENGQWAELPDRAPDDRETLISRNDVAAEQVVKSIQQAFASGLDTMRLTDIVVPLTSSTTAQVGFAEGAPGIRIDPNALVFVVQ
jgi:hypothetical protein